MARVSSDEYGSLADWNGWDEAPGAMVDDADMPAIFSMIGRRVLIAREEHAIDHLQVLVNGYTVTVESYDATGRILTRLIRFIPEPQA